MNDGPALALATANVGVARRRAGTDVAIETARIALLSDDLTKLSHLLTLPRQAMLVMKQNLIFPLSVLAIAVGLAITGILLPVTGALLHELSSLPVIANSARLIGVKDQIEYVGESVRLWGITSRSLAACPRFTWNVRDVHSSQHTLYLLLSWTPLPYQHPHRR